MRATFRTENTPSAAASQQTAPESHFTQHRVCTLAMPTGRHTLSDRRWIVTEHGQRRESAIDDAEFRRILRAEFGITLDP